MNQINPGAYNMGQTYKTKRDLIEGRPALIVIDIQAETFYDRTDEAIPTMPRHRRLCCWFQRTGA